PGCRVRVRPIGTLLMTDRKGFDEKILAVPVDDPRHTQITPLSPLLPHPQRGISAFFRTHKELEGGETDVRDWQDVDAAWRVIEESRQRRERTRRSDSDG